MGNFKSTQLKGYNGKLIDKYICVSSNEDFKWMLRYIGSIYFTNLYYAKVKGKDRLFMN